MDAIIVSTTVEGDIRELDSDRRASASEVVTAVVGGSTEAGESHPASRAARSSIGRYVVLQEVGRGGMGRVLRAYDPKLQREVALKEVRGDALRRHGATRLVAEARAMAMLSHPNVVAVYDVEDDRDRVVLVMEYVDGQTLSAWLKATPRSWRDVVAHFREAGRGLAAAHAASLLHRDFKPSNVLVAETGVKVTDFGLAKLGGSAGIFASEDGDAAALGAAFEDGSGSSALGSEGLTETGLVLGTPRYMAPEQHRGGTLTPAADQYAFCVALWEALCGRAPFAGERLGKAKAAGPPPWPGGPVPRRIADALRRGLSPDPASRFPSMDALLDALAHDPTRTRNRWLRATASVIVVGLGAAAWHAWSTNRAQRCTDDAAAEHLQGVWDDDRRTAVHDAIVGVGASYATAVWERSEQMLDAYATEWRQMHVEACEATTVRGEQSTEVMDRRMACLRRAKVDLHAVTQVLADADAQTVQKAHEVIADLRPLSRCADVDALQADVEPPLPDEAAAVEAVREHIALARAAMGAGHYAEARQEVDAAKAGLGGVTYGPLQTEVAIVEGDVLLRVDELAASEAALREGLRQASTWRQWEAMQSAATKLLYLVGVRQKRPHEGLRYADLAQGLAMGDPERQTAVDSNLATLHYERGAYEEAVALHRRVLATREKMLGPEHADVATSLNNLALVRLAMGAHEEAATLHARALAIREKVLGPEHPDVATSTHNLASVRAATGDWDEATRLFQRGLEIRERALGPDHTAVATSLNNLANVRDEAGAHEEAVELYLRALAIREKALGPDHPDIATNLSNLAISRAALGQHDEAARVHRRAVAIMEKALGPDHPDVAPALYNLAVVLLTMGQHEEAATLHQRALAIWERAVGADYPLVSFPLVGLALVALEQKRPRDAVPLAERALKLREAGNGPASELAEARFVVARALVAAGESTSRAVALAEQARATYQEVGDGHRDDLAAVKAFLREHAGGR